MIGVFLETVLTPIPSPIVLMTAGFVLVPQDLSTASALLKILWEITIPAAIAGTIGNYALYSITYFGGKPIIKKFHRLLGFGWREISQIRRKISGEYSLFFLRAIPIMPLSLVSGAAGIIKLDWKKFGIYTFLGMLPRNFILAFIGWKMSSAYLSIAERIDNLETLITLTIVFMILGIIIAYKFRIFDRVERWLIK